MQEVDHSAEARKQNGPSVKKGDQRESPVARGYASMSV